MSKQHNPQPESSAMESTAVDSYRPNKKERRVRREVWDRYTAMQADQRRNEAESEWDYADKVFVQWQADPDADDWRAHLQMPDAFAAIQAQMQETIERKSRPLLKGIEDSDKGKEDFNNAILKYNLDRTNFDYEYFKAKYSAAIRGTSFMMERYRLEKRKVKDVDSVDGDGKLTYKEKEIVDYDDTYSEWVPNEYIYIDPQAKTIDEASDMIEREILDIEEFKRRYNMKADFINIDRVKPGGETTTRAFFQMPHDMNEQQVEVVHYTNRSTDEYNVLANNVIIRMGPIPFKHKELSVSAVYHYQRPGYFYGLGIPQVIKYLTEERRAIRNLNLDRQKMQLNKMFLKNADIDFDEEETITRPFGLINVETNGLPLSQVLQPVEFGDVPASYFRTEEIILEDIRRAHGIDDRIQGVNVGGTATEAAILKESSQRRINLITQLSEMDAIRRIGKLKWSNIQFFYPAPRIERVLEENEERTEKVYKKVRIDGKSIDIVKGDKGNEVKINDYDGSTTFQLDATHARFMEGDYDVVVDAEASTVVSKPIQQSKITEMFTLLMANPSLASVIDPDKAVRRYMEINGEKPDNWMQQVKSTEELEFLADLENQIMAGGTPLAPTEGANDKHTLIHLNYTETAEFQQMTDEVKGIFMHHITGEHDKNPMTGSSADLMQGMDMGGDPQMSGASGDPNAGMPGPTPENTAPVQVQPADMQATTAMRPNQDTPPGTPGRKPVAL